MEYNSGQDLNKKQKNKKNKKNKKQKNMGTNFELIAFTKQRELTYAVVCLQSLITSFCVKYRLICTNTSNFLLKSNRFDRENRDPNLLNCTLVILNSYF